MKKILFVWFFLNGCGDNPISLHDIEGNSHIYSDITINKDNWCQIHQTWEFVERRISSKTKQDGTYTRKR